MPVASTGTIALRAGLTPALLIFAIGCRIKNLKLLNMEITNHNASL